MPIYAYRCAACGHAKDVLQKISDPLLTVCPSCGAQAFEKQVTAAGFQLKGSGWYVTDFRDNNKSAPAKSDTTTDAPAADTAKTDKAEAPKSAPAASTAAAAAPAGSGGTGSGAPSA